MFLPPSAAAGLITHVDCISRGIKRHVWRVPALLHQTRTHLKQWRKEGETRTKKFHQPKTRAHVRIHTNDGVRLCDDPIPFGSIIRNDNWQYRLASRPIPNPTNKKADDRVSPYRIECQLSVHSDCYTSCYKRRGNRFIQSAAQYSVHQSCQERYRYLPLVFDSIINHSGYEIELDRVF